jgi:hypothetical protein
MRILIAVAACCTASLAGAAPSAVCPPVLGERDMMLNTMSNMGSNKRWAELCKLAKARIDKMVNEGLQANRPCLNERGIKDVEIKQAMAQGAAAADEIFNRSDNKKLFCVKVDAEFDAL